jgi:hypothetical protein
MRQRVQTCGTRQNSKAKPVMTIAIDILDICRSTMTIGGVTPASSEF